ncbi:hypothetical protein IFO70_19720 [Phormidium tenue FACHB-886]|nr:hypothetical protein [Phormidium tenue FACHB-886]
MPTLLLLDYRSIAQAQASHNFLGNLGVPSSSERFFEAGRESFERKIQRLQEPSSMSEELLNNSEAVEIRQDLLRLEDPHVPFEEAPSNQVRQSYNTPRQ